MDANMNAEAIAAIKNFMMDLNETSMRESTHNAPKPIGTCVG
jgi:hypothetical protein